MAGDKRTVLSTKKARDRRQRAARRASKKLSSATPECDTIATAIATATPVPGHGIPTTMTVHLKLSDSSSGAEDCESSRDSDRTHPSSGEEEYGHNGEEEEDCDEYDEEDELVFVCRPTMPEFCTQFVPASQELAYHARSASTAAQKDSSSAKVDFNKFTAKIPAFRETRDGFITYTVTLSTCLEPRKHFQLERRFSEFVSFAAALNASLAEESSNNNNNNRNDSEEAKEEEEEEESSAQASFQWELPPKTWFKVTDVTALEERRSRLEWCLETLLHQEHGGMCRRALVRDFLMLDIFGAQVAEEKQQQVMHNQ